MTRPRAAPPWLSPRRDEHHPPVCRRSHFNAAVALLGAADRQVGGLGAQQPRADAHQPGLLDSAGGPEPLCAGAGPRHRHELSSSCFAVLLSKTAHAPANHIIEAIATFLNGAFLAHQAVMFLKGLPNGGLFLNNSIMVGSPIIVVLN